jgi:hypothetical protein
MEKIKQPVKRLPQDLLNYVRNYFAQFTQKLVEVRCKKTVQKLGVACKADSVVHPKWKGSSELQLTGILTEVDKFIEAIKDGLVPAASIMESNTRIMGIPASKAIKFVKKPEPDSNDSTLKFKPMLSQPRLEQKSSVVLPFGFWEKHTKVSFC